MGYITKTVEVCGYEDVYISIKEVIQMTKKEKEAEELLIGLLKKFPNLINTITGETKESIKLFPKPLKDHLIAKFKKENKPLTKYL